MQWQAAHAFSLERSLRLVLYLSRCILRIIYARTLLNARLLAPLGADPSLLIVSVLPARSLQSHPLSYLALSSTMTSLLLNS